jgi:hypothetical protein
MFLILKVKRLDNITPECLFSTLILDTAGLFFVSLQKQPALHWPSRQRTRMLSDDDDDGKAGRPWL